MRTRAIYAVVLLCLAATPTGAAESDSTATRKRTIIPFPFYLYSPETKSGFGISLSVFSRDESKAESQPNRYSAIALYTLREQFIVGLDAEVYRSEERDRYAAQGALLKFPSTFFGIGTDVDDDGEDYTARSLELALHASRKFGSKWRLGPSFGYIEQELSEFESDGLLETGIRGSEGGRVVSLGVSAEREGRDNVVYARRGSLFRVAWASSPEWVGSDYNYHTFHLDLRRFRSRGPLVLATRTTAAFAFDDVPFQALPGVGGDSILRGYYEDRFRDRRMYSLQAELRATDWKRLGVVVFVDTGDVAPEIDKFSVGTIKVSYGFGLRCLLSRTERLQLRADFGYGIDGSSGLYLNLGESF